MNNELMTLPKCKTPGHGQMYLRPVTHQSEEQKWCGTWYDCPQCTSSVLFPSGELQALAAPSNGAEWRADANARQSV
jgi:hypothetical protein